MSSSTLFQDEEFEYCIADIDGKVPDDLKGTLFRVCPGSMEIGDAKVNAHQ